MPDPEAGPECPRLLCTTCQSPRQMQDFHPSILARKRATCKQCITAKNRRFFAGNLEVYLAAESRRNLGLPVTRNTFMAILSRNGWKCAVTGAAYAAGVRLVLVRAAPGAGLDGLVPVVRSVASKHGWVLPADTQPHEAQRLCAVGKRARESTPELVRERSSLPSRNSAAPGTLTSAHGPPSRSSAGPCSPAEAQGPSPPCAAAATPCDATEEPPGGPCSLERCESDAKPADRGPSSAPTPPLLGAPTGTGAEGSAPSPFGESCAVGGHSPSPSPYCPAATTALAPPKSPDRAGPAPSDGVTLRPAACHGPPAHATRLSADANAPGRTRASACSTMGLLRKGHGPLLPARWLNSPNP